MRDRRKLCYIEVYMENLDYSTMPNLELIQRYAFYVMMFRGIGSNCKSFDERMIFHAVTHEMCKAEGEIIRRMTAGYLKG